MTQDFHLNVVIALHLVFAAAFCLSRSNERFSRYFAMTWIIEAIRAAIMHPDVHPIGDATSFWFCVADVLHFCSTALLLASGAALMRKQIPKWLMLAYLALGIPTVVLFRYWGPGSITNWFDVSVERARFLAVYINLFVMFVPATIVRTVFAWWLYLTWSRSRAAGALIALVFAVVFAAIAVVVPFQVYYDWNPPWFKLFWCCDVLGFSVGMLMLMMSKSEEEIRETNVQLREALEQLETAQKLAIGDERIKTLGRMSAGVAHDINNALSPVTTYADLLQASTDLSPEAQELTRLIRMGAKDTAEIVKRLNHFYRESHDRELLESLNIAKLTQETVKMTKPKWQNQARTDRKQIEVRTILNDQPIVRGDASQLRSVLTNLIFNACDAIQDEGTIEIEVGCIANEAVVAVRDSGMGMTNEQLQHCLEPFYTSKPSGSGLGLSECHGIVRQHGGRLSVSSEEGKSTTVRFVLPVDTSDATPSEPLEPNQIGPTLPRILFIDDDPRVTDATTTLLRTFPVDVETVGDGPTGLDLLSKRSFDLVLCDQGLPGMDGIAVMGEIKRRWPATPVVMVSGWTLPEIQHGPRPDGFIAKPFPADVLRSTIFDVLQRYHAA